MINIVDHSLACSLFLRWLEVGRHFSIQVITSLACLHKFWLQIVWTRNFQPSNELILHHSDQSARTKRYLSCKSKFTEILQKPLLWMYINFDYDASYFARWWWPGTWNKNVKNVRKFQVQKKFLMVFFNGVLRWYNDNGCVRDYSGEHVQMTMHRPPLQ